ncbi:MAG: hypothetical protein AB7F19_07120 [Candidatus Babeliales bacterium]
MRRNQLSLLLWLMLICCSDHSLFSYQQAVIVQPVVDLIGFSFCKEYNIKNSINHYQSIPLCAKSGHYGCARLLQLLYNEQVTIVEAYEDEVRIEISHLFFQTPRDNTQHIGYWTHKRNIMPLAALKNKGIDISTIPKPLSFIGQSKQNQDIISLKHPYFDPITQRTYSAGTRFVQAPTTRVHKNQIAVYALQPKTMNVVIIGIPQKDIIANPPKTPREQQELFISILREWAQLHNGFIPYAWGGCSFAGECSDTTFNLATRKIPSGISEYYEWPNYLGQPFAGFDCAGLIARAAQLAGMPYYFKNTTTLARNLQPLKQGEIIEPGDLIWFSGHVLIVSDTTYQTAIEARGYDHGFGKIQEISLSKLFEGISTYDQLATALFKNMPLKRLNAQEKMVQTIPNFKILKMSSLWSD